MTHRQLINDSLDKTGPKSFKENRWGQQHCRAWQTQPPIVRMITGAAMYADTHRKRYGSSIGEDGFLGPQWEAIIRGIRALLNGECGELDCGTLDSLLCEMLELEAIPVDA